MLLVDFFGNDIRIPRKLGFENGFAMSNYQGLIEGSTKSSDLGFICSILLKNGYCCSSISRHIGADLKAIEWISRDGIKHAVYPTPDKRLESEAVINRVSIEPSEFLAAHMFQSMKFQEIDFSTKRIPSEKSLRLLPAENFVLRQKYGHESNYPEEYQAKVISVPFEEQKINMVSTCVTKAQLRAGFYVRPQVWMSVVELSFVYLKPWEWTLNADESSQQELLEEIASFHKRPKKLTIDDFIESALIVGPKLHSLPSDVFNAYCDWCEINNAETTTIHGLGRLLKTRIESLQIIRTQVNKKRVKSYVGLAIKPTQA